VPLIGELMVGRRLGHRRQAKSQNNEAKRYPEYEGNGVGAGQQTEPPDLEDFTARRRFG